MSQIRLLYVVYFFSGLSALVYQVAWQRLLTLNFGVGPVSVTLIVSVFMAGLGIGAYLGGWLADRSQRLVRLYFLVELAVGIFGSLSLPLLTLLAPRLASQSIGTSFAALVAFLLVPTTLMGTTFPLLTRIFSDRNPAFARHVSGLYFINTLGAAAGALGSSYVIISFLGLAAAIHVAAALNLLLALAILLSLRLPAALPMAVAAPAAAMPPSPDRLAPGAAHAIVFVTGFMAIGYQIIWFFLTTLIIKDSPYAFSSMLAVYLLGIALGSRWVSRRLAAGRLQRLRSPFFLCQLAIAAYTVITVVALHAIAAHPPSARLLHHAFLLPAHPMPFDGSAAWWSGLLEVFAWPTAIVLVPTVCMGISFPLAAALTHRERQEGSVVGQVYFWNCAGNVLGCGVTGFVLIPWLGSIATALGFAAIGMLFGAGVEGLGRHIVPTRVRALAIPALVGATIALVPLGNRLVEALHLPRLTFPEHADAMTVYASEGVEGTVVTLNDGDWARNYINGQAHGGRPAKGFYHETIETLALTARPVERVLVIGYGTGSVVETVLRLPGVRQATVVEINATLIRNLRRIPLFQRLLADPRLELVIEDGRRFLLTHPETRYDVVMLDPLRSTTAYSNNIYSREFFQLVRDHLQPGGTCFVWLDEFAILPRTVATVFPQARLYNRFVVAANGQLADRPQTRAALAAQFPAADQPDLIASWPAPLADRETLLARTAGEPINSDREPWSEYYLGWSIRRQLTDRIADARGPASRAR